MVFPVVMYRCERWTITKAEGRKINAFELWWWRSLLSVPSSARRSNQSILKEIKPEYSLKDWCWSWSSNSLPPDVKNWLIGKDPDIGKDWRQEEKGTTEDEMVGWHHWVNRHEFEQTSLQEWRPEKPGMLQSLGLQRVRHDLVTKQQGIVRGSTLTETTHLGQTP